MKTHDVTMTKGGKITRINGRQVLNYDLAVCFNCSDDGKTYTEFEDTSTFEGAACPNCGKRDTLPKYYIEEMSIPALQAFFSDIAEKTGVLPILDYTFKDFELPGAIKCDYKLSERWTGWTG